MSKNCPHCGTSPPSVQDAYCNQCGGELIETESLESQHYPGIGNEISYTLPQLTFIGRVVVLMYGLLAIGGTVGSIVILFKRLPPGSYQLLYFFVPSAFGAIILCAATLAILQKFGVKVYKDPNDSA